jgi:hypothetical protein
MRRSLILVIGLTATFLLSYFIIGVPGKASEEEEINKLIQTATTPEDHMKIADYYQKQAEKMEVSAHSHASMAASYENRGKPLPGLAKHCSNLSKDYEKAAKEYRAMAMEHKKMAEEMQKK